MITPIFVCACIATVRKNNLRDLNEAASSWTGFCHASGRCVDFFVSSIKPNLTLKKPQLVSVAGAVPCTQESVGEFCVLSRGWCGSLWMLWRCWSCSISCHQPFPPGASSGALLSPGDSVTQSLCGKGCQSLVQLLLEGSVREISYHGHGE